MFKSLSSWLAPIRRSLSKGSGGDSSLRVVLHANEHWKVVRSAASTPIRCLRGKVWITVAGRRDDIVLTPGKTWSPDSNGLAVVGALADSVLCIGEGQCA